MRYAGVCLLAAGITYGACVLLPGHGVPGLMLKGAVCVFLPNLLFFLLYRGTEQFRDAAVWMDERFHFPGAVHRYVNRFRP